jgi:uncharacterized protein (TIGR02266 family)
MADDHSERRSSARTRIEVEVSLDSESHFFTGMTGDLSTGGIFVATYRPIEIGEQLHIKFVLPFGEVDARGRVCWKREGVGDVGPGVGIAFEDLSESTRIAIQRFCDERPPLYYDVPEGSSQS